MDKLMEEYQETKAEKFPEKRVIITREGISKVQSYGGIRKHEFHQDTKMLEMVNIQKVKDQIQKPIFQNLSHLVNPNDVIRKSKLFEFQGHQMIAVVADVGQIWVIDIKANYQLVDVLGHWTKQSFRNRLLQKSKVSFKEGQDNQVENDLFQQIYQGAAQEFVGDVDDEELREVGGKTKEEMFIHKSGQIECIDVAQVSKDIVAYSTFDVEERGELERTLIVYGLQDQSYLNGLDQVVTEKMSLADHLEMGNFKHEYQQQLRWREYWRCDEKALAIQGCLNCLSFSPLGDALVLAGHQFLSVWTRDQPQSTHSFSLHLLTAKEIPTGVYAQNLQSEKNIGEIIQVEFTNCGRAIISLEEKQQNNKLTRCMKVWYNSNLRNFDLKQIQAQIFYKIQNEQHPQKTKFANSDQLQVNLSKLIFYTINEPDYLNNGIMTSQKSLMQYFIQNKQKNFQIFQPESQDFTPISFLIVYGKARSIKQDEVNDYDERLKHLNDKFYQSELWVEDMNLPPDYFEMADKFTHFQQQNQIKTVKETKTDKLSKQPQPEAPKNSIWNPYEENYDLMENSDMHIFNDPQSKYNLLTFSCLHTFKGTRTANFIETTDLIPSQIQRNIWKDGINQRKAFGQNTSPFLDSLGLDYICKWKIRSLQNQFDQAQNSIGPGKLFEGMRDSDNIPEDFTNIIYVVTEHSVADIETKKQTIQQKGFGSLYKIWRINGINSLIGNNYDCAKSISGVKIQLISSSNLFGQEQNLKQDYQQLTKQNYFTSGFKLLAPSFIFLCKQQQSQAREDYGLTKEGTEIQFLDDICFYGVNFLGHLVKLSGYSSTSEKQELVYNYYLEAVFNLPQSLKSKKSQFVENILSLDSQNASSFLQTEGIIYRDISSKKMGQIIEIQNFQMSNQLNSLANGVVVSSQKPVSSYFYSTYTSKIKQVKIIASNKMIILEKKDKQIYQIKFYRQEFCDLIIFEEKSKQLINFQVIHTTQNEQSDTLSILVVFEDEIREMQFIIQKIPETLKLSSVQLQNKLIGTIQDFKSTKEGEGSDQKEISEVLCSQQSQPSLNEPYISSYQNSFIKILLKVVNKNNQYELAFIECHSTENESGNMIVEWTKMLPDQKSVSKQVEQQKPRYDPRGNLIPQPKIKATSIDRPEDLPYQLECEMSCTFLTILQVNLKKQEYHLHIDQHSSQPSPMTPLAPARLTSKYHGYIDVVDIILWEKKDDRNELLRHGLQVSHCLLNCDLIAVFVKGDIVVISQEGSTGRWTRIGEIKNVVNNLDYRYINQVKLYGIQNLKVGEGLPEEKGRSVFKLVLNGEKVIQVDQMLQSLGSTPLQLIFDDKSPFQIPIGERQILMKQGIQIHKIDYFKNLFITGKHKFILAILIKIHQIIKTKYGVVRDEKTLYEFLRVQLENIFTLDLQNILDEISSYVQTQRIQQDGPSIQNEDDKSGKKKKDMGGFDDFFGGDEDEDDGDFMDFDDLEAIKKKQQLQKDKKEAEKFTNQISSAPPVSQESLIEGQYEKIKDELFEILSQFFYEGIEIIDDQKQDFQKSQAYQLANFLLIFSKIYSKDFLSDQISAILLREIYLNSEPLDSQKLNELEEKAKQFQQKKEEAKNDDENYKPISTTKVIKKLANHEIYAQMYGENLDGVSGGGAVYQGLEGKAEIKTLGRWTSRQAALAMFSQNQDVVLDELKFRFDLEANASWEVIRDCCMPLWIKDASKLKGVTEWVCKASYKIAGIKQQQQIGESGSQISKAEATSLWYILINKKNALIDLYEQEKASGGDKVAQMLSQDFSQDRWKKAALKNAMVLRQKQRYLLCITFFILGQDYSSALSIIKSNMKDPVLAVLVFRMLLNQKPDNKELQEIMDQVYVEFFIERGQKLGDVYMESIGYWMQKFFIKALNTLQKSNSQENGGEVHLGTQEILTTDILIDVVGFENNKQFRKKQELIENPDKDYLPLPTQDSGFELLQIVAALKKAPFLQLALKNAKNKGQGGYGADESDIFGDFFSDQKAKKEEKKEEKNQKLTDDTEITVSEVRVMDQILRAAINTGNTVQALFLLRENPELILSPTKIQKGLTLKQCIKESKNQLLYLQILAQQIIADQIMQDNVSPLGDLIESLLQFIFNSQSIQNNVVHFEEVEKSLKAGEWSDQVRTFVLQIIFNKLQRVLQQSTILLLKGLGQKQNKLDSPILINDWIKEIIDDKFQKQTKSNIFLFKQELELRIHAKENQALNIVKDCEQNGQYIHNYLITVPKYYIQDEQVLERMETLIVDKLQPFIQLSCRANHIEQHLFSWSSSYVDLEALKSENSWKISHLIKQLSFSGLTIAQFRSILDYMDLTIECVIIWDQSQSEFEDDQCQGIPRPFKGRGTVRFEEITNKLDQIEIWLFGIHLFEKEQQNPPFEQQNKNVEFKKQTPVFGDFDDFGGFGGDDDDDIDLMDPNFGKKAQDDPKSNQDQGQLFSVKASILPPPDLAIQIKQNYQHWPKLRWLASKLRISIILFQVAALMSIQLKKWSISGKVLEELKKFVNQIQQINKICNQLNEFVQKQQAIEKDIEFLKVTKVSFQKRGEDLASLINQREIFAHELESSLREINSKLDLSGLQQIVSSLRNSRILTNKQNKKCPKYLKICKLNGNNQSYMIDFINHWFAFSVVTNLKDILTEQTKVDISMKNHKILLNFDILKEPISYLNNQTFDRCLELNLQKSQSISKWNEIADNLFQDIQSKSSQNRTFNLIQLFQNINYLQRELEEKSSKILKSYLNIVQRAALVKELKSSRQEDQFTNIMHYFFKSPQKMNKFFQSAQILSNFLPPLSEQVLCLLGKNNSGLQNEIETQELLTCGPDTDLKSLKKNIYKKDDGQFTPASQQILSQLLVSGIELFKLRSEAITDFCFDYSGVTNNIALGLDEQGIREFSVSATLRFRNRLDNGLTIMDEDQQTWQECLTRYVHIEQAINSYSQNDQTFNQFYKPSLRQFNIQVKADPLICTLDSLFAEKTVYSRCLPIQKQENYCLYHKEISPPEVWNGSPSDSYLFRSSNLPINHEDPTYAIDSHPFLPLYITGNRKGLLCAWKFGQEDDQSLWQFKPDAKQGENKKLKIRKIKFNEYGDKVLSCNEEGSFSIYQIELQSRQMQKVPIFQVNADSGVEWRVSDFDLVNHDNIICVISQKQKSVKIYDTLLPYCFGRQSVVMELKLSGSKTNGNLILCNQRKQLLYTFNGRTGAMSELDMRMGLSVVNQYQLSQSHEITAACLNPSRDSLITGYKDGHVKIHRIHNYLDQTQVHEIINKGEKNLPLREKIIAFPSDYRGKKGVVTQLKVNKQTGGLYAASQAGVLKLLRTSV